MSVLEIREITFRYGADLPAVLEHLSLEMRGSGIHALLGASGCGKTTLLRCVAGLLHPEAGEILLGGEAVRAPSFERPMIFQSFDQLFPWFTLRENISYAQKKAGVPRDEREERTRQCLADVGLLEAADAYPGALSGGMRQRGALARALAIGPKLLLLDEPFSSLDEPTRHQMYELLTRLVSGSGTAALLVTHDIDEALRLGDSVSVLDASSHRISHTWQESDGDKEGLREKLARALSGESAEVHA